MDADGNLVKTRGIASGELSKSQKERLRDYLQRKRLENRQKGLDKKEAGAEKKVQTSLDSMLTILRNLDNGLLQSVSAQ